MESGTDMGVEMVGDIVAASPVDGLGNPSEEFAWLLSELGWSKAEFSRRAGYHAETVSRWEEPPMWALRWLRAERMALGMRVIVEAVKAYNA